MIGRMCSSGRARIVMPRTHATARCCCDLTMLRYRFAVAITAAIGFAALASNTAAEPNQGQPKVTPNASKLCGSVNPGSHERYRLPPNRKLPQDISFATDWTNLQTGGWF